MQSENLLLTHYFGYCTNGENCPESTENSGHWAGVLILSDLRCVVRMTLRMSDPIAVRSNDWYPVNTSYCLSENSFASAHFEDTACIAQKYEPPAYICHAIQLSLLSRILIGEQYEGERAAIYTPNVRNGCR